MSTYIYDGPVMMFNKCIDNRWHGETTAPTESKAKSNLKFQCKKDLGKTSTARIDLPGKLKIIE